ncbi:MAG: diguanylate cyclase/phosphodiesterase with sensor(s) [Ilumatobacteraceae bacterium]|nr:diguanylate cyclase/phosphodiesterase with sensor(s) [Ilumatobacteraceae bacterium]
MELPGSVAAPVELDVEVLAGMFRLAPDLLAIASFDGTFIAVNPAWEATLGWLESEIVGRPFVGFVHPDDVEATLRECNAMDERGSAKFVNRYRCRDGSYRWLEWVSQPRPDEGRIYAIARDITERVDAESALQVTKRRYEALLENLPQTMVVLADADMRCVFMAGGALTRAEVRVEDYHGRPLHDIYEAYGDRRQDLLDRHADAAAGTPSSFDVRSTVSGEHYHLSVVPLLEDAAEGASMLVATNISERHRREHQLAVASEQLHQTIEHSPIGMAIVDLDGRFASANAALCEIVGYSETDLATLTFQNLTHPDDLDTDLAFVQQLVDGSIPAYRMEKRYFHKSGRIVWVQLSVSCVRDSQGVPLHFIAQIEDITQRKRREVDLAHRAQRDGLTGLLNRATFDQDLEMFSAAARAGDPSTLLLVDLDRFKEVNDGGGHAAGDALLRKVADAIAGRARSTDRCYRLGGDEFAVILPGRSADQSTSVATELERLIEETAVEHGGLTWKVGASIGAASVDGQPGAAVLAAADHRMYAKKWTVQACR